VHNLIGLDIYEIEIFFFFFSSRRRHTRCLSDWSSDVCSSDLSGPSPALTLKGCVLCFISNNARPTSRMVKCLHIFINNARASSRSEERRVGKECRTRWSTEH